MKSSEIAAFTVGFDQDEDFTVLPSKVYRFLHKGSAGASSEAILEHLLGIDITDGGGNHHPEDENGFKRCVRLFREFPELRPRIGEMATVSPEWAALVARWDELEAAYQEGVRWGAQSPLWKLLEEVRGSIT